MIRTYSFYETGTIPGVPGEFHTGQIIDVDTETNTVVDKRMMEGVVVDPGDNELSEPDEVEDEEDIPTIPLDTPKSKSKKTSIFDLPATGGFPDDPTPQEGA